MILNCARQVGKSTTAAIIALHKALIKSGSLILILAPAERQAKELFSKVAAAYQALGHIIPADSYRKMGMELANGSRIEALPGTEKTIRGFSGVDLLLMDEASRVAVELYYAVRPMLALSGGRLMMLSTPAGQRGIFFNEWTEGVGWEKYEVPASMCPRISATFLEEERQSLPLRVFRQEYECSFEENRTAVFSWADIQRTIDPSVEPLFSNEAFTEAN